MKKLLLAGLFVLLTASISFAVQPMLVSGTRDIGISGNIDFDSPTGDTTLDLAGHFGYFFWDNIEIGGAIAWVHAGGDEIDLDLISIGAFGEYNFDLGEGNAWVPFVGAAICFSRLDIDIDSNDPALQDINDDEDAIVGQLYGGIKYFIADNTAIEASLNFFLASEDIYINDGDAEDTDWRILLGMRTHF